MFQSKNIKEITLAVALQDVCHRVYVKPREETFALQLMEFFDVQVNEEEAGGGIGGGGGGGLSDKCGVRLRSACSEIILFYECSFIMFTLLYLLLYNISQDYTVPGYKLPLSVTSLHTHLWNLAVDYRPLYLPWKLLLTVQSLG